MNDDTALTPEQIDLLLSADLDGEFDAAAADLGLEPAAARARLDADPSAVTRAPELAAARDLLAEPIEIDELLAARLRTKALKAGADADDDDHRAQRARRTRRYGIAGGMAAALIAVIALGATVNTTASSDKDTAASAGSPTVVAQDAAAPTTAQSPEESAGGVRGSKAADTTAKSVRPLPLASAYASVDALQDDVRRHQVDYFSNQAEAAPTESAANSRAYDCEPVAQTMQREQDQPLANGTTQIGGEPRSVLLYGGADQSTLYVFDKDCKLVNRSLIH